MKLMNNIVLGTHVMVLSVSLALCGAAGGDITNNSQVLTCNGKDVKCNYTLNAVGDLKDITVTAQAQTLTPISTPRALSLQFPAIGGQRLFKVIFTKPFSSDPLDMALANVPMEVLFVSSMPDVEARKEMPSAVSMIKIYRRMKGEQLWTERGTILFDQMTSNILPVTVKLNPNGVVDFVENGVDKALYLSQAV
jgi:hypothetical protein